MKKSMKHIATGWLLLLSVVAFGQKIKVSDPGKADFASLKTFTVAKGELTVTGEEPEVSGNIFYKWVKEYVRHELELKGYTFTEDSMADFTVDYVAGSYNINRNEDMGPLGGMPATDPTKMDQSRYWSESYRQGLLVLQIYRGNSTKLLWEAEGSVNLNAAQAERVLAGMIARSFRKFPKQGRAKRK